MARKTTPAVATTVSKFRAHENGETRTYTPGQRITNPGTIRVALENGWAKPEAKAAPKNKADAPSANKAVE